MPLFWFNIALGSRVEEIIHNHSHSLPETDSPALQVTPYIFQAAICLYFRNI